MRTRLLAALGLALSALALWLSATASAEPVQPVADRSQAWLAATLHAPIARRPVLVGAPQIMATCDGVVPTPRYGCLGLAYRDRILVSADGWAEIQTTIAHPWADVGGAQLLIHEQLHVADGAKYGPLEEGVVDALAWDLVPAWSAAVLGLPIGPVHVTFTAEVAAVRRASSRATGGAWTSYAARVWRRALWAAGVDQRAAMWTAAWRMA